MVLTSSKARDLHPDDDGRQKMPRWLPITLLTVTTVALAVPAVILWRQKQTLGQQRSPPFGRKQLMSAPPARRRPLSASSPMPTKVNANPSTSSGVVTPPVPPPRRSATRSKALNSESLLIQKSSTVRQSQASDLSESLLDGPLLSLGALGLATAAVGVGAVLGVWGVQKSLGVDSVDEFATRMRQLLSKHMPVLSQRLYRPSSDTGDALSSDTHEINDGQQSDDKVGEWIWENAEDRLREAFYRGGIEEWAECAMRELEAEEKVERRRRGL